MLKSLYLMLGAATIIGVLGWLLLVQTEKLGETRAVLKGFEISAKFAAKERKRYQDSLNKHAEDERVLKTEVATMRQELDNDRKKAKNWADTDRPDIADEWVCKFARCSSESGETNPGTLVERD